MRVLVIDDSAKAEVKRVLDFAMNPENFYIVGKGGFTFQRPPGDDPRHVAYLNTYEWSGELRCFRAIALA